MAAGSLQSLVSMFHGCHHFIATGIAQWLERRARDQKVAGSSPAAPGRIFFSRVNFLCVLILISYPFHPRVTAVSRKKISVILPKMQVTGYTLTHMQPTYVAWNEMTLQIDA